MFFEVSHCSFCVPTSIAAMCYMILNTIECSCGNANKKCNKTIGDFYVANKHSIATITKLRSLELLIKTPLLHILYYINGLTHAFWTRTGGWEFDRSHGAGTSSPSH